MNEKRRVVIPKDVPVNPASLIITAHAFHNGDEDINAGSIITDEGKRLVLPPRPKVMTATSLLWDILGNDMTVNFNNT